MEIYTHAIETQADAESVIKQLLASKQSHVAKVGVFTRRISNNGTTRIPYNESCSLPVDDAVAMVQNISEQIAKRHK